MKPEDSLEAGLRALAEADRGRNAPAYIEAALVKAFQTHHQKPVRWWIWGGAAAAVAAMILIAVIMRAPRREQTAARVVPVVEASRPAGAPAADQGVRPTKARKVRQAPKKRPAPVREEVATSFIPLQPGDDLEGGQVVRVMLPRTALVTFGLPMNQERALEPVKADVVFGQDGVARAIRFVQ